MRWFNFFKPVLGWAAGRAAAHGVDAPLLPGYVRAESPPHSQQELQHFSRVHPTKEDGRQAAAAGAVRKTRSLAGEGLGAAALVGG